MLSKKGIMTGLNYLQYWMPERKIELAHTRKIMWNYYEILDYIADKEIRKNFRIHFQRIMGYPKPEGNYIEIIKGKF